MTEEKLNTIFEKGSKTFYNASKFFPKDIRKEVIVLYAFVRIADDLVDRCPQDKAGFEKFKKDFEAARRDEKIDNEIINGFVKLERMKGFDEAWADSFLAAMESDLTKKVYQKIEETEEYMYGSANTVGLMMAKIMNLPEESYKYAEMLGKAFQFINFIRDVEEDSQRGRTYFPAEDLKKFKVQSLKSENINKYNFEKFTRFEIERYRVWQKEAEKGFKYIPRKYLIPIKTASDLFKWTAEVIDKNPMIVWEKKIKPGKMRILATGVKNWMR